MQSRPYVNNNDIQYICMCVCVCVVDDRLTLNSDEGSVSMLHALHTHTETCKIH